MVIGKSSVIIDMLKNAVGEVEVHCAVGVVFIV